MNSSMRRRLGAMAVLSMTAASLTACGGDASGGAADSESITFAFQIANAGAKSVFETLAEDYEKAHPGTSITTNPIALNSYGSTVTTQLQAGNGPDVFFINAGGGQAGSVGTLGEAGKLMNLEGHIADTAVPESATTSMTYDDTVVAFPLYLSPGAIVYSPQAAEQSGFTMDSSTSMGELIAECSTVAEEDQAVFGLAGAMSPNTAIFTSEIAAATVYGPEPDWNDKRAAGETTFAESQGWRDALQTVKDLYDQGCFQNGAAGAGFDALTNGAGQGQILGFAAPGGAAKDIMDSTDGAVTLTVEAMPAPDGYDTTLMAGTPDAIAANADTANPELAQDFVEWLSQPEQTAKAAAAAGNVPVGSDGSDLLPQYEGVADLIADGDIAQYPYIDWPNGEIYDVMGSGVTGLLTGQKSVDDVLADMDKAWG